MIKIAIDTGGTFTDYAAVGTLKNRGECRVFVKNPTDHQNPASGMIGGLQELAKACGKDLTGLLAETEQLSHGATLALNALLEKKGVKTALFTTEGFRDALEIRRSQLKNQWDLQAVTPPVLVPRRLRLGIKERIDYKGEVLKELHEESVRAACEKCRKAKVEAIAVCFLFSFLNPRHEQRVREIIREELPHVFVALSSEVAPRIREYERTSTTVINAYLTPVLADYLQNIKEELKKYGWEKPIHMMMNSGGRSDTHAMAGFAAKTLLSGPAGGACGNEAMGKLLAKPYTVLADMGGTSFDLHVVSPQKNGLVPQSELAGYPLTIPMIDITSIGAGGGSIAQVDQGGRVLVGPASAGSVPGPACYRLGGKDATVTDALLLLGLVDEHTFLGGRMTISRKKAEEAIAENIAKPLGVSTMEAAQIVYRIGAERMADALRLVTMEKGNDPRDYTLIAAGGAFPLFAGEIAKTLQMSEVFVPIQGPVFCAWGMLGAACRYDITHSFFMEREHWQGEAVDAMVEKMRLEGEEELKRLGVPKANRSFALTLEMRYLGQHHEISVPWQGADFGKSDITAVDKAFHDTHESIYAYAERENPWEIVNLHLACTEKAEKNTLFSFDTTKHKQGKKIVNGEAFGVKGEIEVPLFGEGDLTTAISGPALVEFDYTTAVIPLHCQAIPKDSGILSIKKEVE